ncbi:MAG: proline reductase cluster protein PrdD [Terrisporobacter sp.]
MSEEIQLRRLVIKSYHINEVEFGEENSVSVDGKITINKDIIKGLIESEPLIESIDIQIIKPGYHDIFTNTIMDIIPISTKVLGRIGEGITHTLTGAYVMLTGVDVNGVQTYEFGSSEGILKEQLKLNRPGTPGDNDIIISFNVTLLAGSGQVRPGPTAAHNACDKFCNEFRANLKKFNGNKCTERHEFHDKIRPGKKKVVIIKQVAGQGAMYDTQLFSHNPSAMEGGRSIIDMGNVPMIVTPNEYRDGALRCMC